MAGQQPQLAGFRERDIATSLAKSSSPIDNSIACRHAVMTFNSVPRIKSQGTRHRKFDESLTNDQFLGIDELADLGPSLDPTRWVA
jgi:hypothetical protein